jgi:septum formation protein
MRLVLASTSRYRRELLSRLHLPFEVLSPDVDETPLAGETPSATALRLSVLKAQAGAATWPDALIIGSDQVLMLDSEQLGKPGNFDNAFAQLKKMQGRAMVFHTALTLLNSRTGQAQTRDVPTVVHIRPLTDAQIAAYLEKEKPYDCAGSARSESLGIALMERMDSPDPTALIGLPLMALTDMLMNIEAGRRLYYYAGFLANKMAATGKASRRLSVASSIAKAFCGDMAMKVTTDAIQVMGGYGYMKDYPVEKYMRDAKIMQIYEGTAQIQRYVIAANLMGIKEVKQ